MSKLAAIICVAFLASATHGFWFQDLQGQFYLIAQRELKNSLSDQEIDLNLQASKTIAFIDQAITEKDAWLNATATETAVTQIVQEVNDRMTKKKEEQIDATKKGAAEDCLSLATVRTEKLKKTAADIGTCGATELNGEKIEATNKKTAVWKQIKTEEAKMSDCLEFSSEKFGFISAKACYSRIADNVKTVVKSAVKILASMGSDELYKKVKAACGDEETVKNRVTTIEGEFNDCMS